VPGVASVQTKAPSRREDGRDFQALSASGSVERLSNIPAVAEFSLLFRRFPVVFKHRQQAIGKSS